jgi:hypothetical protein
MRAVIGWVKRRLVTADAVYGLILYAALLAVVSVGHVDALEVLLVSFFSLVVFWAAHVYAGTIANHGMRDGIEIPLARAFRESIAHASGMLYAAVLPSIVLVLGSLHVLTTNNSVSYALVVVLLMLAALGYQSFAARRAKMVVRIFGALGTAAFGLVMIVLNTIVH